MVRPLDAKFFGRSALDVAPDLLGCLISSGSVETRVVVRIDETEAYTSDDPASHSFRGPTKRNEVMFGPAGYLYVYFTYGMHWCANVVTGPEGTGEAVLLRGGVIESGLDHARARRRTRAGNPVRDRDLTNGPAKLTQTLAINGAQNGLRLDAASSISLAADGATQREYVCTPRIGISVAMDRRWRFVVEG